MAEVVIAVLLRRTHGCKRCTTIAYIDDVHLLADSPENLAACIALVLEFVSDFALQLSALKTVLWASEPSLLTPLSCKGGFSHREGGP